MKYGLGVMCAICWPSHKISTFVFPVKICVGDDNIKSYVTIPESFSSVLNYSIIVSYINAIIIIYAIKT